MKNDLILGDLISWILLWIRNLFQRNKWGYRYILYAEGANSIAKRSRVHYWFQLAHATREWCKAMESTRLGTKVKIVGPASYIQGNKPMRTECLANGTW